MQDNILMRRDGEDDFHYHKRLIYAKLVDKQLPDVSYSELSELLYGQRFSEDVCRRLAYGSCKTLQLLDRQNLSESVDGDCSATLDDIEMRKIELQKERQRFFDQRVAFNKLVRERAREEEVNDIIVRTIQNRTDMALKYEPHDFQESDNDLLVSLSDIHFGACYENYWGKYDSDECAKMMTKYVGDIISIAHTHHSQNCIVWANGDLISGFIHKSIQVTNKENVIQQIVGVSELIACFLAELSKHFAFVGFVSVAGNHSRIEPKEDALLGERLDDLVEWYLKARMAGFENVCVGYGDRIDDTMYVINVRGLNYVGIHGDYDPTPQHVQALQTFVQRPVYAVLLGHMHHNKIDIVQGIRTVMAGSFLGMDDYCISKRLYGKPEQIVCVCNESGIVCSYNVSLTAK